MKIIIVEDEPPALRHLERLLKKFLPKTEVIARLESIQEVVEWFNEQEPPDLMFLDIQLADGLSFEIFNQTKIETPIVFTTAYDEYALKAFQTTGIAYLLKPIQEEKLKNSIEKFQTITKNVIQEIDFESIKKQLFQQKNYKERFLVKQGKKLLSVPIEKIAFFMTEDRSTVLYTKNKQKYVIDFPLEELETMLLPKNFFRLNRKIIVEIDVISEVHQYFNGKLKVFLKIPSQQEIIVSREKSQLFKKWLNR